MRDASAGNIRDLDTNDNVSKLFSNSRSDREAPVYAVVIGIAPRPYRRRLRVTLIRYLRESSLASPAGATDVDSIILRDVRGLYIKRRTGPVRDPPIRPL